MGAVKVELPARVLAVYSRIVLKRSPLFAEVCVARSSAFLCASFVLCSVVSAAVSAARLAARISAFLCAAGLCATGVLRGLARVVVGEAGDDGSSQRVLFADTVPGWLVCCAEAAAVAMLRRPAKERFVGFGMAFVTSNTANRTHATSTRIEII